MSSWWDKYLAPGDIRKQRQETPPPPPPQDGDAPTQPILPHRADATTRARRQNAMFYGGIAFSCFSLLVTRRAMHKKYLAAYPHLVKKKAGGKTIEVPTFTPSTTAPKAEGGIDAAEALYLATLGVFSVFMTGIGAFMKYNDIGDMEDMRDFVRAGVGYDVYAGDTDSDKEIEQWMAEVLSRKEGVGDFKTTIVEKMAELAELDKKKALAKESKELADMRKRVELEEQTGRK